MDWLEKNVHLVGATVVLIVVVWILAKLLLPKKKVIADEFKVNVLCRKCKWQGIVTKYNQVCRKCNSRELDVL